MVLTLQPTFRRCDLLRRHIDSAQLLCQPARQIIHRIQSDVEPIIRMVNRQHADAFRLSFGVGISQIPTCSTTGRVPTGDCGCTADVGKFRQGIECGVALGEEAVGAVRAGNVGEGRGPCVISFVVAQ